MKFKFLISLFIVLFSSVFSRSFAQVLQNEADKIYGLDPLLYNGRVYTYFVPSSTNGNQFLSGREFSRGEVSIRGTQFKDVDLNYDIFNQQLLLSYHDLVGAESILEISKAWLNSFRIGNRNFELIAGTDSVPHIYQVIGDSSIRILYSWRKDLNLEHAGTLNYIFSAPLKTSFINIEGRIIRYKNNKGYVSIFKSGNQEAIKKYLRQHRISVKKASDLEMYKLISYCIEL